MSDKIDGKNADLYAQVRAALNGDSVKVEQVNVPVDFGVFGGGKVVKGDIKDSIVNYMNNRTSANKPETNINPDGSGTKVTTKTDKNGNLITTVETLGAGGKVLKKQSTKTDKNGKKIATENINYDYDKNGKLKKTKRTYQDAKQVKVVEDSYGENGKIEQQKKQISTKNGKKVLKESYTTKFEYDENNELKQTTTRGKDSSGKPTATEVQYENGKKVSSHSKFYKRGALNETFTDYKASAAGLPSTKIVYGADGKTVEEKIENTFDADGILSGQKITDASGNVTERDYSKLDGKFDIGCQQSRGDCYLLAGINALSQTPEGQQMLQQTITESVDENGKKVYTITFPGAKMAREGLISGEGDSNIPALPEDKVHIQESYTVTEDELKAALKQQGAKYSVGDRDVVLLELGFEKYRQDVSRTVIDNNIDVNKTQYIAGLSIGSNRVGTSDTLSGGQQADAIFILTGNKAENQYRRPSSQDIPTCYINSDMSMTIAENGQLGSEGLVAAKALSVVDDGGFTNDVDSVISKLQRDCADGKLDEYAATAGFVVSSQEVNGEVIPGGGHALTITKVTDDTVYMTNPWDPSKTVTMSIEDFKKSVKDVSLTPLKSSSQQVQQQPEHPASPSGQTTPTNPSNPLISQHVIQAIQDHIQQGNTPQKPNYRVPKGQSYTNMIKEALINQGIENPTKEQIAKAKEQFAAANPEGTLHVYNGKNRAYQGNVFLLADSEVYIPKFDV